MESLNVEACGRGGGGGMECAARKFTEVPLSPCARLFLEPYFKSVIVAIIGFKKPIDIDAMKAGLSQTIVHHPRFSSILVQGKKGPPKWVKTNLAVEKHLVIPEFDPKMDVEEKFLEKYLEMLDSRPLDTTKPLWEFHLLNAKVKDSESFALLRFDHSLGDGISIVSLFLACSRKCSDPTALPTLPQPKQQKRHYNNSFSRFLISLWMLLQVFWYTLLDVILLTATILFLKDSKTPIKGTNETPFRPKRVEMLSMTLDDIKLVKNAISGTVNDVMLGVTVAGLIQYLNRNYEKNSEKAPKGNNSNCARKIRSTIPKGVRVRAAIVFNTRKSPGLHELAGMMAGENKDIRWGNQLGYSIIPFSLKTRDDPLQYLRQIKAICDKKKLSLGPSMSYSEGELITKLFGIKAEAYLVERLMSHTSLVFSNIVGPVEEIELFGNPINFIAGHSNAPHALSIHIMSYAKVVNYVLSVDEEVIPDPDLLCQDIAHAFNLIKDSVGEEMRRRAQELKEEV